MNDDAALGYVLGTLDEDERAALEARLDSDRSLAEAVANARGDVEDIATGIRLVAAGAGRTSRLQERRLWKPIAAAAAAVLLVAGGVALLRDGGSPQPEPGPSIAVPIPGAGDLENLVRDAIAIVTGTVVEVRDGGAGEDSGGIDYQIAIVEVEETLKGEPRQRVVAFDYTYGAPWVKDGQRVLLFLASSLDTVHEGIDPPHDQVLNGDLGSYEISEGRLVGAPFTLDEVRAAARD